MHEMTEARAVPELVLVGDSIGLDPDEDAVVRFRAIEAPRGTWHVSLVDALAVAHKIDEQDLERMTAALHVAAEIGNLSAADLAAWRAYVEASLRQWLPVVYVQRGGGAESHTHAVVGEPVLSHHAAMNEGRRLCDELGGDGYGARRVRQTRPPASVR